MSLAARWQTFSQRSQRLQRHLHAAVRYQTPRRLRNLVQAEYERIRKIERVRSRPYILIVDPLNICQLKCPLCPTGASGLPLPSGKMRLDKFQYFLDQVAPYTFKINFYNWGEPFIHHEIIDMLTLAHERRISSCVSSNLNALPPGGAEAVVRSGLDDLIVSCDGLTQETYVHYRRGGELAQVTQHLREIVEWKKKLKSKTPHIEFQFLVFEHNEHEVPQVERFARDLGANTVRLLAPYLDLSSTDLRPARNPKYRKEIYDQEAATGTPRANIFDRDCDQDQAVEENPPPLSCFWPWRSIVVNWDGQVDPCCSANFLDSFGNIFEQPFEEIWNGPAYIAARRWIAGKPIALAENGIVCRGCPGYV